MKRKIDYSVRVIQYVNGDQVVIKPIGLDYGNDRDLLYLCDIPKQNDVLKIRKEYYKILLMEFQTINDRVTENWLADIIIYVEIISDYNSFIKDIYKN